MRLEWDEEKHRINLTRHGIDFVDLAQVFEGLTLDLVDERYDYGERRLFALGLLNGEVICDWLYADGPHHQINYSPKGNKK